MINFQTNSCGFFVCLLFPDETAFSSILRIKTISFGRHSILREKKSPLASNFELTSTLTTIWRAWYNDSYTMIAKPIKTQELHYPVIQFLIILCNTWPYMTIHCNTLQLTINERGWVSYEDLWRSRRVVSVVAVTRGGCHPPRSP